MTNKWTNFAPIFEGDCQDLKNISNFKRFRFWKWTGVNGIYWSLHFIPDQFVDWNQCKYFWAIDEMILSLNVIVWKCSIVRKFLHFSLRIEPLKFVRFQHWMRFTDMKKIFVRQMHAGGSNPAWGKFNADCGARCSHLRREPTRRVACVPLTSTSSPSLKLVALESKYWFKAHWSPVYISNVFSFCSFWFAAWCG